jgi:hypothetical protein
MVSAQSLLGFQIFQQIIRNLETPSPATQPQARLVGAVVVAAASDDHAEACSQSDEVSLLGGLVLTIVPLEALHPLTLEVRHGFVPAETTTGEAAGMGDHRHAASFPDPECCLGRAQFFSWNEAWAVIADEPLKGLGRPAHEPPDGEGLGEMDPREQGRVRLGLDILEREGAPQLSEAHQHAAVPVFTAAAEFLQSRLEPGVKWIHQEPQYMQGLPEKPATELGAHKQSNRYLRLHGEEGRDAAEGVMVRETEGRQPTFLSEPGQSPGRICAVRMERMAVEIDHDSTVRKESEDGTECPEGRGPEAQVTWPLRKLFCWRDRGRPASWPRPGRVPGG